MKKRLLFPSVAAISVGGLFLFFLISQHQNASDLEIAPPAPGASEQQPVSYAAPEAGSPEGTSSAQPAPERQATVAASPKQTEIRQQTDIEYTYYPLLTANDPGYGAAWALQQVKAPEAWDIATGNDSTVVAVIDSGFALNHDDLTDSWYVNAGEQGTTQSGDPCWTGTPADKSSNGCDDDGNDYEDDWRGWNFYLGDNNPAAGRQNPSGDAVAHGTQTAGLVGARGNNSTGIATINWQTKVMPLQVLSDDGPGYTSDVVAAIVYAVDNGADVINMSLGGNVYDGWLKAATDYAYENGVVVVAAAGNCGTGTESGCSGYPAGHIGYPARNPHVISVGATTDAAQRASFSSYGEALDVVAPGSGAINSPTWTAGNQTSLYTGGLFGTSFASPMVASLASLIKSIRPNTSVDDVTALILATAQKTNMGSSVYTPQLGHGIIDAQKALTVATAVNQTADVPRIFQAGTNQDEHTYAANTTQASGCEATTTSSYCTVWLLHDRLGYDRYLPYTLTNASRYVSWQWPTSLLTDEGWTLRSVQGDYRSSTYSLSRK